MARRDIRKKNSITNFSGSWIELRAKFSKKKIHESRARGKKFIKV